MPFHKDLRLAGLLPPVDAPHHMRVMEWKPWREGVVLRSDPRNGSFVDVGLYDTVRTFQYTERGHEQDCSYRAICLLPRHVPNPA